MRLVRQFEAAAAALRGQYGVDAIRFLDESGLLEHSAADADAVAALLVAPATADGHVTELIERSAEELRVRVTESATGFARTHRLRNTLFESSDYKQLVGRYAALIELAGTPPFAVALGEERDRLRAPSTTCARACSRSRRRASASIASRASAR